MGKCFASRAIRIFKREKEGKRGDHNHSAKKKKEKGVVGKVS